MSSGLITSWEIEEEKVGAVTDFISLDSRITADSDCSHEIKRCLLNGRCQSWTINKAESWRTDAFELWCWRKLLRVPWRRSNQSILKEINPEYSLEGLMLKFKLQFFWPPDVKSQLIGKDPDAGKDWRQEKKGMTEDELVGWHHRLEGHEFEQTPGDSG